MKVIFSLVSAAAAVSPSWEEYKSQYGYNFNGDQDSEYEVSYAANVAMIESSNAAQQGFQLGVNQFTLFSLAEFQAGFMGEDSDADDLPSFQDEIGDAVAAGSTQDWSTRTDIVNPIKDQGACGSCWAFGAVAVYETEFAMTKGTLHNLAEQQLVDCDKGSAGCQGGLSRNSFSGYYKTQGACTQSSYAYTATGSTCSDSSCTVAIPAGLVIGYSEITATTAALQTALLSRPLKVSVYGDSVWQGYSSGIASDFECHSGTNHAVMAVGFDSDSYWKLRNSWGPKWGEGGYIRVTQTSSCATGPTSIFGRTPIYPKFGSFDVSV